jgi:exosortase
MATVVNTELVQTDLQSIRWARRWLAVGFVAVLIGILYASTLVDLAHDWWTDEGASYGILIPPIALYIAWVRRQDTLAKPVAPDGRGVLVLAFGCMVFLVGRLGAEFFLTRISFVVVLTALIWTFWGLPRLRTLTFPLVLLLTMVPLPNLVYNTVGIPLQLLASWASAAIIQAFGGTIFREGNVLQLPNITLGVAEACSGLRSLASLSVASLLVGFLNCKRLHTQVLLFALAIPLAVGVNILRVTGTAWLATYREEFAMGFYHSFAGWLVFLASFGILWFVSHFLHRTMD